MDLGDGAVDRELAALFFEQPRAVHQLALVDLPDRSSAHRAAPAGGNVYSPLRRSAGALAVGSGSDSGSGGAGRLTLGGFAGANDRGPAAGGFGTPERRCLGVAARGGGASGSGVVRHGGGGPELRGRRAFLRVLGDHLAPLLFAAAFLPPFAKRFERRATAPAAAVSTERREQPAERKLRGDDDRQQNQRQDHDHRAGAIEVVGQQPRHPVADVAAGSERRARRPRACRRPDSATR